MHAVFLLVTVLVGLAARVDGLVILNTHPAFQNTQDPQLNSSLQFVYAFFRHGIRSPLYKPYPKDPNKSKYYHYFPGPPGQLTKAGKQMMYNVGKNLQVRYKTFVGEYEEVKIYVSSTNTSRTIMTALSVMAGLFPPCKTLFKDLKWQPIPVWQDTEDFDKAYIYNDPNFPNLGLQDCPKYGMYIEVGYDLVKQPDSTKGRQYFYQLLQNYTGDPDVNSVDKHYQIWDTLQFESLNGLPLPAWATQPQPQYKNKPFYPDLMEPVMLEWFKYTEYLFNIDEMLYFYSGPLFDSIYEHLKMRAANPKNPSRMRFHATHDTTLFVLLWALKLTKPATVGPGDGILFELHLENHNFTVKIFYYDANHGNTIKELISPLCPPPCYLNQFVNATRGLNPQKWQKLCKVF